MDNWISLSFLLIEKASWNPPGDDFHPLSTCFLSFIISYLYLLPSYLPYSFPVSSKQEWKISAALRATSFNRFRHPYKYFQRLPNGSSTCKIEHFAT